MALDISFSVICLFCGLAFFYFAFFAWNKTGKNFHAKAAKLFTQKAQSNRAKSNTCMCFYCYTYGFVGYIILSHLPLFALLAWNKNSQNAQHFKLISKLLSLITNTTNEKRAKIPIALLLIRQINSSDVLINSHFLCSKY